MADAACFTDVETGTRIAGMYDAVTATLPPGFTGTITIHIKDGTVIRHDQAQTVIRQDYERTAE